jgi:hypothetical protein
MAMFDLGSEEPTTAARELSPRGRTGSNGAVDVTVVTTRSLDPDETHRNMRNY